LAALKYSAPKKSGHVGLNFVSEFLIRMLFRQRGREAKRFYLMKYYQLLMLVGRERTLLPLAASLLTPKSLQL
jgi:hypothetical protein